MALKAKILIHGISLLAPKVYLTVLVCAIVLAHSQAAQIQISDAELTAAKLDRLAELVEGLYIKFDHLEKITQKHSTCKHDVDNSEPDPSQQLKQQVGNSKDKSTSYQQNEDRENHVDSVKETYKRESKDESTPARELFHFNKLAPSSMNTIPSSSSPWTPQDEGNLNDWLTSTPGQHLQHEQRQMMLSIGQQYETMFGTALDNLNSILKEQLAGFRLTLNKLMNRIMDHSYQYNMVANQLSLVKDECSLAAACPSASMIVEKSDAPQQQQESVKQAYQNVAQQQPGVMRSSDITMLVRLLSQEMSHLMHESRAHQMDSDIVTTEQAAQLETTKILNETRSYLTKRLNEIDSVVKQSALFLTKLTTNMPRSSNTDQPSGVTIIYNNSVGTEPKLASKQSMSAQQAQDTSLRPTQVATRWFPGSKVPGKSRLADLESSQQLQSSSFEFNQQQVKQQKCQSKTSLIRPSSCQQLRLAGANCTGQYYVFVRGLIRHVYCDMNMDSEDDGGGWTVVLRRIDKSLSETTNTQVQPARGANQLLEVFKASQVNFNLDWLNYKNGFGQLNEWAEFFSGLDFLHQITSDPLNQTTNTELQVDLETSSGRKLHLRFDKFHVAGEEAQYKLSVGACNGSLACDPIVDLNGSSFYTFDRLPSRSSSFNESETSKCAQDNSWPLWGWWWPDWLFEAPNENGCRGFNNTLIGSKHFVSLTTPIGKRQASNSRPESSLMDVPDHIHWPNWEHSKEPLKRLVMKVRRKRLAGASLLM